MSRKSRPKAYYAAAIGTSALLLGAVSPLATAEPKEEPSAPLAVSEFQGVNWADPRDNFASDAVVPSGLSTGDDYATTYAKAESIISEFAALGANTVRLPVNPPSVNGDWWGSYTGAIDAATDQGFKVILGYWEADNSKDGRIDDGAAYDAMWDAITSDYVGNDGVYFEPMNEPHGYAESEWLDIAADWLSTYPSVPRERVLIGGTGYSEDVTPVCADSRLDGTLLALHQYGFWHEDWTSYDQWASDLRDRIGSCASRTVLDEFGAAMTTGLDYNGPINGSNEIAYIQAATDAVRELGLGSVYWPGLRNGDSYSLTTLGGSGTDLTLEVTNQSGLDRLHHAWGQG
ncbi:glycoside hydrolase family 5 protein [Streptomyces triticirhizae]|uniref:Cellulase n=1 Tax=Streptomyces triticirhizae TaxID=2483353 RepID=A0A3M2M3I8_9ACTN|nr:cellulase family glycosylhydrolase [Streptomyces triticirhizae]RMI43383.1 cellulase [Streptomyces triticirhizae]